MVKESPDKYFDCVESLYFNQANTAKGNYQRLSDILFNMEHDYRIPATKKDWISWEEKTPNAARIREVYKHIVSLWKSCRPR